jgi:hypothetical protein
MEATDMRAWILGGSLAAAVGAAACGTQAAAPFTSISGTGQAGQSVVRCEPGQHAVVNQSVVDGSTITSVGCALDGPLAAPVRTVRRVAYREPVREAVYEPAPAYEPAPVARPAVVRDDAPAPEPTANVTVEEKPTRSWQKRAIVIGGSSGAGAGLGAIIGGKKGALIGAAIGGGAGTIYEMQK